MKNINKNSIIYGLGILAILAFGVMLIPGEASADRVGYVSSYNSTRFTGVSANNQYNSYTAPNSYAPVDYASTPVVYSGAPAPAKVAVAEASTAKKSTATAKEDTNGLVANAIFGTNSFMPSGLIQWILFAIFILLMVILVRKFTGPEDKYHSEPLKHA